MIILAEPTRARYLPELLPHATLVTAAAGAEEPIFQAVSGWNQRGGPERLLRLVGLSTTQGQDLEIRFTADETQGALDGAAQGTFPTPSALDVRARRYLAVSAKNQNPAAALNIAARFGIWVEPLRGVGRAPYGVPIPADEQEAMARIDAGEAYRRGDLPPSEAAYIRHLERVKIEGILVGGPDAYAARATLQTVATVRARPNEALILRSIAASTQAGADQIHLYVDRDGENQYVDLELAAMDLENPIQALVPAVSSLTFSLQGIALGGATRAVSLRAEVWRVRLSLVLQGLWGITRLEDLPGDVRDRILSGVI